MRKIIGVTIPGLMLSFFSVYLYSCKQDKGGKNLLPLLSGSDSAVAMYYHTPGNPRFFNMTKVYDQSFISLVAEAVNKKTISPKDTCTTQGKIYFYSGKQAVETVYFSRLKDCMSLSFIKTGEKYFTRMSRKVKEQLDELEKKAISLPVEAE